MHYLKGVDDTRLFHFFFLAFFFLCLSFVILFYFKSPFWVIFLLSIGAVVKVKSLDYLLLPLNTESFSETGKKNQIGKRWVTNKRLWTCSSQMSFTGQPQSVPTFRYAGICWLRRRWRQPVPTGFVRGKDAATVWNILDAVEPLSACWWRNPAAEHRERKTNEIRKPTSNRLFA